MEKFQLNNINNIDNDMWNVIDNINWKEHSSNLKNKANDEVAVFCVNNLSLDEISEILNFIVNKRNILMNKTREAIKNGSLNFNNQNTYLSDDTLWDLCSHIVGLGKETYDYIYNNITDITNYLDSTIENFEYGFDKAIYELHK